MGRPRRRRSARPWPARPGGAGQASRQPAAALCLDHVIVLNERHLRRLLRAYLAYYDTTRPHQALRNDSPLPRDVHPPALGHVVTISLVAGLHHRYHRAA